MIDIKNRRASARGSCLRFTHMLFVGALSARSARGTPAHARSLGRAAQSLHGPDPVEVGTERIAQVAIDGEDPEAPAVAREEDVTHGPVRNNVTHGPVRNGCSRTRLGSRACVALADPGSDRLDVLVRSPSGRWVAK